jgi:hypothetical protein
MRCSSGRTYVKCRYIHWYNFLSRVCMTGLAAHTHTLLVSSLPSVQHLHDLSHRMETASQRVHSCSSCIVSTNKKMDAEHPASILLVLQFYSVLRLLAPSSEYVHDAAVVIL